MIEPIQKEEISIKTSVDFLVPFTNVVINHLSEVDLLKQDLETKLEELQINKISDDEGRLEFSSIILDFDSDFFTGISFGVGTQYKGFMINLAGKNLGPLGLTTSITISKLIN